jgi:ribose/xylose/arabinose/galactoside ABC-type transport system permease subunit
MKLTSRRFAGFCALVALMIITRSGHLGTAWSPPDASWAVLYLAGFYFGREWRWALPTLLATAVAVDCIVIRDFGVSSYCVTMAYVFMVPAYALLWLGGMWIRRAYRHDFADLARWAGSLGISASLCFFLTNASFYWLGGRIPDPTLGGWWRNFTQWYPGFIAVPFVYTGIAALLHAALARPARARVEADVH